MSSYFSWTSMSGRSVRASAATVRDNDADLRCWSPATWYIVCSMSLAYTDVELIKAYRGGCEVKLISLEPHIKSSRQSVFACSLRLLDSILVQNSIFFISIWHVIKITVHLSYSHTMLPSLCCKLEVIIFKTENRKCITVFCNYKYMYCVRSAAA